MTVARALQQTEMRLGQVSDAPALDAAWLLLHVLGTREASWLTAHADVVLTSAQIQNLETLTQRRAAGEPLAYILGEWEFYGRPFLVTPDVLIPRPATEALVDATLRYLRSPSILRNIEGRSDPLVVADVGTGSGCIAITLALELQTPSFSPLVRGRTKQAPPLTKGRPGGVIAGSGVKIIATDISPAAIAVAKRNAERHGVLEKIEFMQGDMLAPLLGRQVDLIVSNPPYVPTQALAQAGCTPETRGLTFEPKVALDGGSDGQEYVRQLAPQSLRGLVAPS